MAVAEQEEQFIIMKRFLFGLMLMIISIHAFSQIAAIQPQKQRFEFLGSHICYDTETGEYDMIIKSDNQFEDKTVHLNLGKSVDEVMSSLKNLKEAIMVEKSEFKLEGYDFYVASKGRAAILGVGKLSNTAGTYYITDGGIYNDMMAMIDKYNLDYGKYQVVVYSINTSFAMFSIKFTDYGASKLITLNMNDYKNKFTSFINANKDDVLTDEQIQLLVTKIKNGTIRENKDSQYFLKVFSSN